MINRCDEDKAMDSKIKEMVLRAVKYYFDGMEVREAIERARADVIVSKGENNRG